MNKGLINTHKYDDIIKADRPPVPDGHPRMSIQNRAKIFSPFSALRGFDDKISDENGKNLLIDRPELSDDDKEVLSKKLASISKGSQVTVTFFIGFEKGYMQTLIGSVIRIDLTDQILQISGNPVEFQREGLAKDHFREIDFSDILSISIL